MPKTDDKHNRPESYEHWDLNLPELPARSVLYQIRPVGIGTAETESLASYLARLANAHHTRTIDFTMRYLFPMTKIVQPGLSSANGVSVVANELIDVIERLTLGAGIRPTTFVLWANVIQHAKLLKDSCAWCAECYADQAAAEGPIYDHLRWAVGPVKICLRHNCALTESCPTCKRRIPASLRSYLPGFCLYCHSWMGRQEAKSASSAMEGVNDDRSYERWAAEQIGSVIAASPALPAAPTTDDLMMVVNHCCNLVAQGNLSLLAHALDISGATLNQIRRGSAPPSIKTLVKLSYLTKIPLLKLLTDSDYVLDYLSKHPVEIKDRPIKRACYSRRYHPIGCQRLREQVEAALTEIPPPSLAEVARRVGYKHASSLRAKFPELSKQIVSNYQLSERYIEVRRSQWETTRSHPPDRENQRKLLEQELGQSCPGTLAEISHKLGYSCENGAVKVFPELCRALVEKRRQYKERQLAECLSRCRQVLTAALAEEPPPTLHSVMVQLGLGYPFLKYRFPRECREISARRLGYQKMRLTEAGNRLRQALLENPPRSFRQISNEIANEIGVAHPVLRCHYPELVPSVVSRFKDYKQGFAIEEKVSRPDEDLLGA
jgi:transcriptional regulator with XRE-family HTH domain